MFDATSKKLGLILFALGVIIYLTRGNILVIPLLFLQPIFGNSDAFPQLLGWIFYSSYILIIAGIAVFFVSRRQKNRQPAGTMENKMNDGT